MIARSNTARFCTYGCPWTIGVVAVLCIKNKPCFHRTTLSQLIMSFGLRSWQTFLNFCACRSGCPFRQDDTQAAGQVYVFRTPLRHSSPDEEILAGEDEFGQFGYSLALSEGGRMLAIGAPTESKFGVRWRYGLAHLLALCEGNPPATGGFPSQRASKAKVCWFLCCYPETRRWAYCRDFVDLRRHYVYVTLLRRQNHSLLYNLISIFLQPVFFCETVSIFLWPPLANVSIFMSDSQCKSQRICYSQCYN